MNERRATKRALLTSITALVMCVVMLVGTTFAWFTDTAKTNVNRIEAGKLDVALEMQKADGTWENAEGKTLNWVKATAGSSQDILWEPGAEYKLPELKVVNNGNLALKYEIAITGAVDADGDDNLDSMKLLNVLKFKSVVGGVTKENAYGQTIATGMLDTNGAAQIIKLSAKMDENAGNGYMNMALSNITVTVKAMQASYEYDSNGNTYDLDANGNPDNPTWSVSAHVTANVANTGNTVLKNADGTVELTAPAGSTSATSLTLKVEPKTAVDSSVNITVGAGQTAQPYEISLVNENGVGVTATGSNNFTVKLYVGKGLDSNNVKVYHNSTVITGAQYDSNSGYVTFTTSSFSPFTVVFDTPVAIVGDTYYNTLAEAVAAAKDGDIIKLLRDVSSDRINLEDESITVDLNGHTLTSTEAYGVMFCAKNGKTITVNGTTPGSKLVGTVMVTAKTDGHIVLNGGTYESDKYVPVYINGAVNTENSTLKIKDAVITAIGTESDQDSGWGVYLAGYATSTIENTKITAPVTGIEIRAGKLDLTNCTVTGGNGEVKEKADGSGTTVTNAAVAVSQHTTKKNIDVTIKDGEYTATAALYQSDVQGTGSQGVKATVLSGMFAGEVKAATEGAITISGGAFTTDPTSYLATGYTATEGSNGVWTVTAKPNT